MRLLPLTRASSAALLAAAAIIAAIVLQPLPVQAACYETIGCTNSQYFKAAALKKLSCQNLWTVRNTIYRENGYCFKTPDAIAAFGLVGCRFHDMGAVPLNAYERSNVGAIVKVEKQKRC